MVEARTDENMVENGRQDERSPLLARRNGTNSEANEYGTKRYAKEGNKEQFSTKRTVLILTCVWGTMFLAALGI